MKCAKWISILIWKCSGLMISSNDVIILFVCYFWNSININIATRHYQCTAIIYHILLKSADQTKRTKPVLGALWNQNRWNSNWSEIYRKINEKTSINRCRVRNFGWIYATKYVWFKNFLRIERSINTWQRLSVIIINF